MTSYGVQTGDRRFDPLEYQTHGVSEAEARTAALQDRTLTANALKKLGYETRCWTLPNQLLKYASFGVPDGRVRSVYHITVREKS